MEFIPIEKYTKKGKKKGAVEKETKAKNVRKNEKIEEKPLRKGKYKPQRKIVEMKKTKKKGKEKITKKKGMKGGKKQKKEEEEEDDVEEEEEGVEEKEEDLEMDESKEGEEEENSECPDEDEEAVKQKCKKMGRNKDKSLLLKLKKVIINEAQIKQLHPDIRSVIIPRKKRPRWCWAVFSSKEKANAAMVKLMKNKDIIVKKPAPHQTVVHKKKEKMMALLRNDQIMDKLQKMWS